MSKRVLYALGAGVAAAAAVVASAASLGTVDSTDLGAGASVVASCDSDGIGVDYTTKYAAGGYVVEKVKLTGVAPACANQTVKVTLAGASNQELGSGTATVSAAPATSTDVTIGGNPSAKEITNISVVISG